MIENALVINLPSRPERLQEFDQEVKYLGIDSYGIVSGIVDKPVQKGIAQAHLNCISIATQREWNQVLIMEDDCVFPAKEKTLPYLTEALKHVPSDWDIILGGIYYKRKSQEVNAYWNKVGVFCALHWYIVNSRAYEKILAYPMDSNIHIDHWLGKQGLNVYYPKKLFAIQRDGYSDNVKKITDYNSTKLTNFTILK